MEKYQHPTSPIEFTETLGDTREPRRWCLAAMRARSRESSSVQLTGEEVAHVLSLEEVRLALKESFGVTFSADKERHYKEQIVQLTERVAELQTIVDRANTPGRSISFLEHDLNCQKAIWALFDKDMSFGQIRDEIERLVKADKNIRRVGTDGHPHTKADEVVTQALKRPNLAAALSLVATWDNERAVRQALRNVGPDNRKDTSHGGLWDTTFEHLFTRVLDAWPELAVVRITLREHSQVAETLWQLLDDIDSLGDAIKPSGMTGYTAFYERACNIARRRHEFLKSDGNRLTWPDGDKSERKSNYTFEKTPEYDPSIYAKHEDLRCSVAHALAGEGFVSMFPENAEIPRFIRRVDRFAER